MRPTDILREEHRVILAALATLERASERLDAGRPLPDGWWEQMIEWLRAFADRNHHAKEERSLFTAMAKAGVPARDSPVSVMLDEHVQGRVLIQSMSDGEAGRRVAVAQQYVGFLRDHIAKEDGFVFPLAESVLDEQALQAVGHEFETVEIELGRDASVPHAEMVVKVLADALG